MPIVNVKVIENAFTAEQKQEIVSRVTEAMIAVEGENMRQVTWVYIEDIKEGEFAIGGQCLRASDIHTMQRGD